MPQSPALKCDLVFADGKARCRRCGQVFAAPHGKLQVWCSERFRLEYEAEQRRVQAANKMAQIQAPKIAALTAQEFVSAAPPKRKSSAPTPPEVEDPTGPGSMLIKQLATIGIKASANCACKARARVMNQKGCDWCEENIDMIVGWLREEATRRKLPFIDLAGKLLVRRAIKLSRKAQQKAKDAEQAASHNPDT